MSPIRHCYAACASGWPWTANLILTPALSADPSPIRSVKPYPEPHATLTPYSPIAKPHILISASSTRSDKICTKILCHIYERSTSDVMLCTRRFKNLELETMKAASKATRPQALQQGPPLRPLRSLRSSPQLRPRGRLRRIRPQPRRREPPRKPPRVRQESPQLRPRQPEEAFCHLDSE